MNDLDKQLEAIADEAKKSGNDNLAIILYCYLGSKKAGLSSHFSKYCQNWARQGLEEIKTIKERRNN